MQNLGEFDLIQRYFDWPKLGPWSSQGVGDDCALIDIGTSRIAVTTDMLIEGTHFFENTSAYDLGHKSLAVNLSDLAAAAATPRAFFLSIAVPKSDPDWMNEFQKGLFGLAKRFGVSLLGGDTVRSVDGKITVSITALGELPAGTGLTRSGARVDDDIWVSGSLGGAYAAVQVRYGKWKLSTESYRRASERLDRPEPRNRLGEKLLKIANACCDISDGLLQDIGHIMKRSGRSCELTYEAIPQDASLNALALENRKKALLAGGDDYELLWTAPRDAREAIATISAELRLPITRIGRVVESEEDTASIRVLSRETLLDTGAYRGFDHFSDHENQR